MLVICLIKRKHKHIEKTHKEEGVPCPEWEMFVPATNMQGTETQVNDNFRIISRQRPRYPHFGMKGIFIAINPEGANDADPEEYVNDHSSFALATTIPDSPQEAYFGLTIESTASTIDGPMYVG